MSDSKFQVSPFRDGDASKNYIKKELASKMLYWKAKFRYWTNFSGF